MLHLRDFYVTFTLLLRCFYVDFTLLLRCFYVAFTLLLRCFYVAFTLLVLGFYVTFSWVARALIWKKIYYALHTYNRYSIQDLAVHVVAGISPHSGFEPTGQTLLLQFPEQLFFCGTGDIFTDKGDNFTNERDIFIL